MTKNILNLLLGTFILMFLSCTNKDLKPDNTPQPVTSNSTANQRLTGAVTAYSNYKSPANELNSFSIRYYPNDPVKRPLIIAIHGGGFLGGQKENFYLPLKFSMTGDGLNLMTLITADQLDDNGFAYASINYRVLAKGNGLAVPNCLNDGKEFLDFIRANTNTYNIDPNKIILLGYSGGADIALWLGLRNNNIRGIVAMNPQATLNIYKWESEIFAPNGTQNIFLTYFPKQIAQNGLTLAQYCQMMYAGKKNQAQVNSYCNDNDLNLFNLFDSADPELYMASGAGPTDAIHAASHVWALKQKSAAAGHKATVVYAHGNWGPDYWAPNPESVMQFCIRKFQ